MTIKKRHHTSGLRRASAVVLIVLLLLLCLIAALAINAWRQNSKQPAVGAIKPLAVDEQAAAARLAGSLRFRTISHDEGGDQNADEFRKLHAYLEQNYPHAHAVLKREVIGGASLLYTWQGSDPKALPVMLMAHQDVVPVAPGTEGDWKAEPFAGTVKDGYIWGRGSWDDKGNLFSIMEAVETLAQQGFRPRRTIYLAMGHDEEIGGRKGATAIAALLKSRGVRLDYVMDEGLVITQGILKGLDKPAALIGIAEKGYATVQMKLATHPGHSSMPPQKTAIGMMSTALANLENKQLPADLRGVAREMFETLAPEMSGLNRVLLSNLWLFRPLVLHELQKSPSTNAMVRTTTALTVFQAGNKENVLPGVAEAAVNFRLLPGDSVAHVHEHVREAIGNDAIKLSGTAGDSEPSAISKTDVPAYRAIQRTVREVFPGTIVAPGLMVAATDSRHFEALSNNIYRFSPVRAGPEDLTRFHGTNERISVANYADMIRFYHRLLSVTAGPTE